MTIDALERKSRRSPGGRHRESLPIGELDANIFNCPACARPLGAGTSRCSGCGTRLIAGIKAGPAMTLMTGGLLVGVLIGGGIMAGISAISSPADVAATTPVATALPVASAVPVASAGVPAAPAGPIVATTALSALRQTALLNQRLVVDAGRLTAALAVRKASTADLSRILRSLAASATFGDRVAPDLADWSRASTLSERLTAFYAAIGSTARQASAASLSHTAAYVAAARAMLVVLDGLPTLDAEARALAAQVDLAMPPATIPAATTP
ncbi:MAG: hypothetical protein ABIQ58_09055 [Candidatus Limnocylindrales bacterium]